MLFPGEKGLEKGAESTYNVSAPGKEKRRGRETIASRRGRALGKKDSFMKAAVFGAGNMGLDIAQVFAVKGHDVVVRDISDELIQKGEERLKASLARQVEKGRRTQAEADAISAKIVAEVLKLPMDRITVVSGDTDSCAFDTGAYASSGTFFSGNASLVATRKLKDLIIKEAALQLEEKEEDLDVRAPGEVYSKATGAVLSYYELVHTATSGGGRGQPIAHGSFVTTASSVPYGAHFAQVAVNVRTGEIKVQKFYALQDAGTPINPEIALCQMYGAVMKSIGHSLYEDMKLDKDGKCINANLTDYGAPMIDEAPDDFKSVLIDVDDKFGPFGAKSISEIACNGAAPAIGIAIHDACGVWVRSWPMTPEKILKALGKL